MAGTTSSMSTAASAACTSGSVGLERSAALFDPDPALPAGAAATPGVYAATGHLLYVRDRVLTARRFDPASRAVTRRADHRRRNG